MTDCIFIDREIVHEDENYYKIENNSTYCFQVECFEKTCNVAIHVGDSPLEKWLELDQVKYDDRQEIIDDNYNFEFNYNINNNSTMVEVFSVLLGDRMGFYEYSTDWIYSITEINSYQLVDFSNSYFDKG